MILLPRFLYAFAIFSVIIKYFDCMLERRIADKSVLAGCALVYAGVLSLVNQLGVFALNGLASALLIAFIGRNLYKGTFVDILCVMTMCVTTLSAAEFSSEVIFLTLYVGLTITVEHTAIFVVIRYGFSLLLQIALIPAIRRLFPRLKSEGDWEDTRQARIFAAFISLLALIVLHLVAPMALTAYVVEVPNPLLFYILIFCLLVAAPAVYFIYDNMIKKQLEANRKVGAAHEMLIRQQQYSIEQLKRQSHDFKNQLLQMQVLRGRDGGEADAYHNALVEELDRLSAAAPVDVNNIVAANTIELLQYRCRQNHIRLKLELHYNNLSFIKRVDANRLLGNLFDNAVEACGSCSDPWLLLHISRKNQYLFIAVSNSVSQPVQLDEGRLMSHKRGRQAPGYGLATVREIAERYGGSVQIEHRDARFSIMVRLEVRERSGDAAASVLG